jgi:hypothetical protein
MAAKTKPRTKATKPLERALLDRLHGHNTNLFLKVIVEKWGGNRWGSAG